MLIKGLDPGGVQRPVEVDENGNLRVDLVSGVSVSTVVSSITSITDTLTVNQLSGSAWSSAVVSGATSLDVQQVSGSAWSIATGPTSLDVQQVSGANWSSEVSGVARTTNPTAVADTAAVKSSHDDLGRQVITPYQVRDLLTTAYVTTTTGVETTLGSAVAGVLLDCVQIVCSNESGAAVDVDFRAVTGGNVEFSLSVPANATSGFIPVVPWPQGNTGNNWTMDVSGSDVSNTTVNVAALFIRNV